MTDRQAGQEMSIRAEPQPLPENIRRRNRGVASAIGSSLPGDAGDGGG